MVNHEIFGCHVTSVSIILVSLTFILSTLVIGATAFVPLSLTVLLAVIIIGVIEITTCGMHIIAIRESASRMILPNVAMSAFNIVLFVVLCVLSVIDVTSGNQVAGTEVLLLISPASFAADSGTDDVSTQPNNSVSIVTISIILSTLCVVSSLFNAFVLYVHVRCYRYLVAAEKQFTEWTDTESRVDLFPETTEKYEEWPEKIRLPSIQEEDEDDFYYRYLAE